MKETYLIEHNILTIDEYVFPGGPAGKFFHPDKWPDWVKNTLSYSEELCEKYNMSLIKGELDIPGNRTLIAVEADSPDKIRAFYKDLEIPMNAEKLQYLKIEICEDCDDIDLSLLLIKAKNSIKSVKEKILLPSQSADLNH